MCLVETDNDCIEQLLTRHFDLKVDSPHGCLLLLIPRVAGPRLQNVSPFEGDNRHITDKLRGLHHLLRPTTCTSVRLVPSRDYSH
jgi:hypothetical protein